MGAHTAHKGTAALPAGTKALGETLARYPWFTSARIMLSAGEDKPDPMLALYLYANPAPTPFLPEAPADAVPVGNAVVEAGEEAVSTVDIIDKFLNAGEYRITPDDDTPEFDAAATAGTIEITEEIATEQLARIYRAQGMVKEAEEVERKLAEGGKGA